ncbi:ankyrin repeat domain-containing protein [Xanthomonas campestris]|uniref:ankyrin repeat domain-containing protein n=1 Tax=Xanthomonas campestris TaxID=339 RepID=UPI000E710A16|nr:ankyrin repeat domain-containing protein [Xanthomonas campestris]MCW1978658.1 ankyrin repeat protein [Xanthomonas campestris]RJU10322.1 ankyrin repeat domain-containing protein [Xanthomonas campestris]
MNPTHLSAIFEDYERLPEYSGIKLDNINTVSLFGDRPINIAATRGSIPELELLFHRGADINNPGEHGYTPLHNAVEQGMQDAARWLIEHGADRSCKNISGLTPKELATLLDEKNIIELLS